MSDGAEILAAFIIAAIRRGCDMAREEGVVVGEPHSFTIEPVQKAQEDQS